MHPYEMRRLMKLRHKDDRLVLKPGSLYNAVSWLLERQLIEVTGKNRQGRRPQRTTYALLPAGARELTRWLGQLLGDIRKETSSFSVGLDHLLHLPPELAIEHLETRRLGIQTAIGHLETNLPALTGRIGRINVIESEYDLAVFRAQDAWIGQLVADLRSGALRWNTDEILAAARQAAGNQTT
jgi:DNA-binding PadR family transcriptional regulator